MLFCSFKVMKPYVVPVLFIFLFCAIPAFPCTTFVQEGGHRIYLGRNLDWDWQDGMVFVNPRNIRKTAIVINLQNAARWTSRYGSVTFNQLGREMPFGGMNEAGLVVECMWLDGTQYPKPDARPEINMLQWIQYQLDNCRTVAEVIASNKRIRLENTPIRARIHYLVCDATGACATIEFLDGAMHVHQGNGLPYRALANDTYSSELAYLDANPKQKEISGPLAHKDSLSRFCRAAERTADFRPAKSPQGDVAYAFKTLDEVRQARYTAWQIVYDVSDRKIYWRTLDNPRERCLDLKKVDFAPDQPERFADIQSNTSSWNTLKFQVWTEAGAREYCARFFSQKSFRQEVGDITWMIQPTLLLLRTYTVAQ